MNPTSHPKLFEWLYDEESSLNNEDQDPFSSDNDSLFLNMPISAEESISDSLLEPWSGSELPEGDWPDINNSSTVEDILGFTNIESFNSCTKPFSNPTLDHCTIEKVQIPDDEKPESSNKIQVKSEILPNHIKCKQEIHVQETEVTLKNSDLRTEFEKIAKVDNTSINKELHESIVVEQYDTQKTLKQKTESFNFAIWALKSILPECERNGLDETDKGSVLHATADYIEKLRGEINANLHQLGVAEDEFWHEFELRNAQSMQREEKVVKSSRKPEDDAANEVKRPPNAFIRFSVAFRKMVAQDFPNRSNREISQMLGSIWRRMRQEEKEPFINQFYCELQQTRRDHPEWNYAGKNSNRLQIDLDSVQPERLRPRNHEQNFSYKNMQRRLTAKSAKTHKTKKAKIEIENWAQCDSCNKWRKLPDAYIQELPERWICSMNPDQTRNNCDVEEES